MTDHLATPAYPVAHPTCLPTEFGMIGTNFRFHFLRRSVNSHPLTRLISRHGNNRTVTEEVTQTKEEDTFGSIGGREVLPSDYLEDDDDKHSTMERVSRRLPQTEFEYKLANLKWRGGPDKVKKMTQVFEEMQREGRYRPNRNHYTLLIAACADLGLTEKAFAFFDDMQKKFIPPTPATVTALFNSCAEGSDKKINFEKLDQILDWLNRFGWVLNDFHYNALIKAFAKNGDLKTAFEYMVQMAQTGHRPQPNTFSMLLMGCISDTTSGFSHAIRIVKEARKRGLLELPVVDLFIRTIRDSGIGTENHWMELLKASNVQLHGSKIRDDKTLEVALPTNQFTETSLALSSPVNLLTNQVPPNIESFNLEQLDQPHNRLMLVGGLDYILDLIKETRGQPTIKTWTTLLFCLPPTREAENELIARGEDLGIAFDIDFFNMCIKRRSMRKDIIGVQETLSKLTAKHLYVDIVTFGVVALGCDRPALGLQLLEDMKNLGFNPNETIMSHLIHNALENLDFAYLKKLLENMTEFNISIEPRVIESIEKARVKKRTFLKNVEQKGVAHDMAGRSFDDFQMFYKNWLETIQVEVPNKFKDQFEFEFSEQPRHKMFLFERTMRRKILERKGIVQPKKSEIDEMDVDEDEEEYIRYK